MVKKQTFLFFVLSYIFIFINSANPSEKHKIQHIKKENKFNIIFVLILKKILEKNSLKEKYKVTVVKMRNFHLFHYPYI